MKVILGMALISTLGLAQSPAPTQSPSGIELLSLKVKDDKAIVDGTQNASDKDLPDQVTHYDPNAGRPRNRTEGANERIERQTNERIQNMHALENAKLDSPKQTITVPVYQSRAELKNVTTKEITQFVWAYRASPQLQYTQDQEFFCRVSIKAGETKSISAISPSPDHRVVKVTGDDKTKPVKPSMSDVIINRVEFADGSTWQRTDWNALILASRGARKIDKGKCAPL